jgi:hypothetical protein
VSFETGDDDGDGERRNPATRRTKNHPEKLQSNHPHTKSFQIHIREKDTVPGTIVWAFTDLCGTTTTRLILLREARTAVAPVLIPT